MVEKKYITQKQTSFQGIAQNVLGNDLSKTLKSINNIFKGKYINNEEKLKNKIESLLKEAKTSDKKIIKYLTTNIANKFIESILNQSSSIVEILSIENLSPEEKQKKFDNIINNIIEISNIKLSPSPNQSRNTAINILSGECMTEPSLFISNQSYQEEGNSPLIENSPPSTLLSNPLESLSIQTRRSRSAPPRNSR